MCSETKLSTQHRRVSPIPSEACPLWRVACISSLGIIPVSCDGSIVLSSMHHCPHCQCVCVFPFILVDHSGSSPLIHQSVEPPFTKVFRCRTDHHFDLVLHTHIVCLEPTLRYLPHSHTHLNHGILQNNIRRYKLFHRRCYHSQHIVFFGLAKAIVVRCPPPPAGRHFVRKR